MLKAVNGIFHSSDVMMMSLYYVQIVHKIDDETEVIYSATSAVGPVSSRDFVSLRQIDNSNGCYMSACVATVHGARPPQPGRVR